jgi:hypothetical protein
MANATMPLTEFSVDIKDPWTIAAITLLSLLVTVAIRRVYYTVCKRSKKEVSNRSINVTKIKIKEKVNKSNFQTRAEMRGQ